MRKLRRRLLWVMLGLAAIGLGAWLYLRPPAPDTRFSGAYRLADGRLVLITPREGKVLRYRLMSGESSALWPVPDGSYEAGPGWAERQPVEVRARFLGEPGAIRGLRWWQAGRWQEGRRLPLPERAVTFASGELTLRGKLVTPAGSGPFPALVLAHGSERDSAVDFYFEPYLFASHGIATLVFDKRGTGESEGSYTQYFPALAGDVVAAVGWLHAQPGIDTRRIHLAGFSQGGWVAPLAAARLPEVRSLLVGYGPTVPVLLEDRWGYVYTLRQRGFGDDAVAGADRLAAIVGAIFDRDEDRWAELAGALAAARSQPWFGALAESDSIVGAIAATKAPLWGVRLYLTWRRPGEGEAPFIDRLYDPAPTVAKLAAPSLWILGGEDSSMPSGWTLERLRAMRAAGRPVSWHVFPRAEHGIRRFVDGPEGRRDLGYEPGYLPLMVRWVRKQSGLRP